MSLFITVKPRGSRFAKTLQTALKTITSERVLRVDHVKPKRKNFVVTPQVLNKISQLNLFKANNVSHPAFTTNRNDLAGLDAKTVFARTLTNSTGGKGIVEFTYGEAVPAAPLYTAYIAKKAEYRVHVAFGKVIDIQQKKKKRGFDADARDTRIRNLVNGYVYTRENITPPANIDTLAINAVKALGYQYGAVDVVYNEKRGQCYVLEVNSRPGLMGTTMTKYASAIKAAFNLKGK